MRLFELGMLLGGVVLFEVLDYGVVVIGDHAVIDDKTYRLDYYSALSGTVTTSSVATVTVNDPSALAPWYETFATETDFGILCTVTRSGL